MLRLILISNSLLSFHLQIANTVILKKPTLGGDRKALAELNVDRRGRI